MKYLEILQFYNTIEILNMSEKIPFNLKEDYKVFEYLIEESKDIINLWQLVKEESKESDIFKYLTSNMGNRATRCYNKATSFYLEFKNKEVDIEDKFIYSSRVSFEDILTSLKKVIFESNKF